MRWRSSLQGRVSRPGLRDLAAVAGLVGWMAVGACATVNLDVVHPMPIDVRAVSLTVVDRSRGEISPDDLAAFTELVREQVSDAGIDVVSDPRLDLPRVEGSVLQYDPGNRALRYVSIGFGTGSMTTGWRVTGARDKAIAACRIDGSVSAGTFGGSITDVQEEIGQALARFLRGGIR